MRLAEAAVFLELQLLRRVSLVLRCRVVSLLALGAGQGDDISHCGFPFSIRRGDSTPPHPDIYSQTSEVIQ
jgi:hypothetical protein